MRYLVYLAPVVSIGWLAACFHPSYEHPACGPEGQCPDGYTCSAAQICERGISGSTLDAGLDGPVFVDGSPLDGSNAPLCAGSFLNVCVDPPGPDLSLTANINTDSSTLCVPYTSTPAVDACVIAARSITVPPGLQVRATGKKKLILVAANAITIAGTLDGSSDATATGPAANLGPCNAPTAPTSMVDGGGGAGGSFNIQGGGGGLAAGGTADGGVAGNAITFASLALRGGCAGGNGAKGGAQLGAVGGPGGGALALIAKVQVSIGASGVINASGGGAVKGTAGLGSGGGGGGSGGMILLDAPTIQIPDGAQCFANGGGGGEGFGAMDGNAGGVSPAPTIFAAGGANGTANGGDGGRGAIRGAVTGDGLNGLGNGNNGGGGGGGGGAYGFIVTVGTNLQITAASVSPAPNTPK